MNPSQHICEATSGRPLNSGFSVLLTQIQFSNFCISFSKVGCVFPMVLVSILPHTNLDQVTIGKTHSTLVSVVVSDLSLVAKPMTF